MSSPPPITPPAAETTSEEDGLLLQNKLLDDVSEARPLAKLQEELEEHDQGISALAPGTSEVEQGTNGTSISETRPEDQQQGHEQQVQTKRKPLLNDNDHELDRISGVRLMRYELIIISTDVFRYFGKSIKGSTTTSTSMGMMIMIVYPINVMRQSVSQLILKRLLNADFVVYHP